MKTDADVKLFMDNCQYLADLTGISLEHARILKAEERRDIAAAMMIAEKGPRGTDPERTASTALAHAQDEAARWKLVVCSLIDLRPSQHLESFRENGTNVDLHLYGATRADGGTVLVEQWRDDDASTITRAIHALNHFHPNGPRFLAALKRMKSKRDELVAMHDRERSERRTP